MPHANGDHQARKPTPHRGGNHARGATAASHSGPGQATGTRRLRHRAGGSTRPVATALVALGGLALLILGPTALAFGWQQHQQRQDSPDTTSSSFGTEIHQAPATFVVHELRCGTDEDGTRNGMRCEATIGARNDGEDDLTIPGSPQVLHNAEGVRHLPIGDDDEPFGTLKPGDSATAVIEYDVPSHVTITGVGVHVDPYAVGELVQLTAAPLPLLDD